MNKQDEAFEKWFAETEGGYRRSKFREECMWMLLVRLAWEAGINYYKGEQDEQREEGGL